MNDIASVSAPPRGPQFDNRRVLAGLIDVLIVGVVAAVVSVLASGSWSPALSAVVLGWGLFYYFALESGGGQTVGKRALGLRVTMADGSPAEMRAIAMRTLLRLIDGIGIYLVGLIVMLITGERRQRLGDLAGGTIITSADYRPAVAAAVAQPAAVAVPATSVVLPPIPAEEPTVVEELPVVEEPKEPVVVEEPAVAVEPVVAVEPAVAEEAVEAEQSLPAAAENEWTFPTPVPDAEEAEREEPVKVRSVERVSAIDLVMDDVEADEAAGQAPTA